jgi:general secretion pathway protein G
MVMLQRSKQGFTLIEIMLVVIIIGILAAMIVPNIAGRSDMARKTAARTDIESNLATTLDLYHMDTGRYPTTEQGLIALVKAPTTGPVSAQWSGPYLKKKRVPKDPWGHEYIYVCPGVHNPDNYDLSSLGADGVESSDDITNWEKESK